MAAEESADFESQPHAREACQVRRWDDEAKDPAARTPPFSHFAGLLTALAH
jgi:gamma-butyrobetaine dioxygenase